MWKDIEYAPEGLPVLTCIDADTDSQRNEQRLVKRGSLWWLLNGSMYVCILHPNTF